MAAVVIWSEEIRTRLQTAKPDWKVGVFKENPAAKDLVRKMLACSPGPSIWSTLFKSTLERKPNEFSEGLSQHMYVCVYIYI